MTFDPAAARADFPIFRRRIHEHELVYLDSAATSQKPQIVIDAISSYYQHHNANVHRGVHTLGDESTREYHRARTRIAEFFGANANELVITRNATEGLNLVALRWGEQLVHAGDVIISSELEHHSNLVPWQELAKRVGAKLILLTVDEKGSISLSELKQLLKTHGEKVKIMALSHVSNALGSVQPLTEIATILRELPNKPLFVVDGAQGAPHVPINFSKLGVDVYAMSAHKMLGPMGIGGLLVRHQLLTQLPPLLFGGGMIDEVENETSTFAENLEDRFTAGTPDVASLVGWAAACQYLTQFGMETLQQHDHDLVSYTLEQLAQFPQIKILGPSLSDMQSGVSRIGSVSFVYDGVHAHDVGQILDAAGVAVRSGHHCTMPLHRKFGWAATTRISFQLYNTRAHIDACITALHEIKKVFGR